MALHDDDTNSLLFDFGSETPNVVDLNDDYNDDSDGTLLGDEFEERFIRPTPDIIFVRAEYTNADLDDNDKRLDSYSSGGQTFKPGKSVELRNGDFLRITAIVPNESTRTVSLKGIKFRRNRELNGLLESMRNEVTMLLEFNGNDPRDIYHQSVKAVGLAEVVKIRELIKTNRPFPDLSYRGQDTQKSIQSLGKGFIKNNSRLVCRTKLVLINKNEGSLQFLLETETDEGYGTKAKELRTSFRGETKGGGMCGNWLDGEEEFDQRERTRVLNLDLFHFHHRYASLQGNPMDLAANAVVDLTVDKSNQQRRYTFGDAFCGAGGASRGAKGAELRVDWGFDYDRAACDSYCRNFYATRCEAVAAHEFVTVVKENFQVDILHLSPPCQTFSPAHTRPGKNDELNEATFLAVGDLLRKINPRIVTLEETFGLTRTLDNLDWFNAMIQLFIKLGFSVRWKVFNLSDFGLPQPRKRLFIFASCPGEVLPEFPKPTHCKEADLHQFPHLSRFATVDDAIRRIPKGFSMHNPEQMPRRSDNPYPGNVPLRNTITCNGGPNCHPSGKRSFTLRELACLQGFPLEHQFGPIRTRMQIGNAVPPVVAKVFFEQIKKALLKADGLA